MTLVDLTKLISDEMETSVNTYNIDKIEDSLKNGKTREDISFLRNAKNGW